MRIISFCLLYIAFSFSTCKRIPDPGKIGNSQKICFGSIPEPLIEINNISGIKKPFRYQWQYSIDSTIWKDIEFANDKEFSPLALSETTWFRRNIIDPENNIFSSGAIQVEVSSFIQSASLNQSLTINRNSSANFNFSITGGYPPYRINYSVNGVLQPEISNYFSGDYISTGILSEGIHKISLVSIEDVNGCSNINMNTSINISVNAKPQNEKSKSNKALLLVNSNSIYYLQYYDYIKPYIDNFGIPYDVHNTLNNSNQPNFHNYGIIIFGHNEVYNHSYPLSELESAISSGTGLISFDIKLFNTPSEFSTPVDHPDTIISSQIRINNTKHYITSKHAIDEFNPNNDIIELLNPIKIIHNNKLKEGIQLAGMDSSNFPILQVSEFGDGRIVKWNSSDWVLDTILGPVFGMDDLLWRGIVWAARKPFVMQGMPPFLTMRVDDVQGINNKVIRNFILRKPGNKLLKDFKWIKICNNYGIIPWCGVFNDKIPERFIHTLKDLIDNNRTTASPHAFSGEDFIYFNHFGKPDFNPSKNVIKAKNYFIKNDLTISNYLVPHFYEISPDALEEIKNMGIEFVATHVKPGDPYMSDWINCGPYRINRNGNSREGRPVFYGDFVNWEGYTFFNCVTEIRDDSPYKFEWYPTNDVNETSARGIRHLRRAFNSQVLATLYTHEYEMRITPENWDKILYIITNEIKDYNPEYVSMDYALEYIRARNRVDLLNITEYDSLLNISYTGENELETRCYLFTEYENKISSKYIILPRIKQGVGSVIIKNNIH
jgi:hypothetical protein